MIIVYRDNDQLEKINQEIDVAHKKFKKSFSPIFAKGGMERYESVLQAFLFVIRSANLFMYTTVLDPSFALALLTNLET